MRRILFALAVLPLSCFAQSVTVNPPSMGQDSSSMAESATLLRADPMPANPSVAPAPSTAAATPASAPAHAASAPTASEQGYDPQAGEVNAQAEADYQALHTPRQLGQLVRQPAPLDPVASNRQAQGWLANWTATLVRAGVPESKVNFEAQRLDRDSFAAWAYRQMLASHTSP